MSEDFPLLICIIFMLIVIWLHTWYIIFKLNEVKSK